MKFRQEKNEARPVDRDALRPGDKVEYIGYAYVICPKRVDAFAVNLSVVGYTEMGMSAPIYRIEITGTEKGRLTWERVTTEPKAVQWDELKYGELFVRGERPATLYKKWNYDNVFYHDRRVVAVDVVTDEPVDLRQVTGATLYRAELVEIKDGTVAWRTK